MIHIGHPRSNIKPKMMFIVGLPLPYDFFSRADTALAEAVSLDHVDAANLEPATAAQPRSAPGTTSSALQAHPSSDGQEPPAGDLRVSSPSMSDVAADGFDASHSVGTRPVTADHPSPEGQQSCVPLQLPCS